MERSLFVVASVVLLSAGVASGQAPGTVVSYWVSAGPEQIQIVPSIPGTDGFVLTDLVVDVSTPTSLQLIQMDAGSPSPKLSVPVGDRNGYAGSYHFESGILFDSGSTIDVLLPAGGQVTVSGIHPLPRSMLLSHNRSSRPQRLANVVPGAAVGGWRDRDLRTAESTRYVG